MYHASSRSRQCRVTMWGPKISDPEFDGQHLYCSICAIEVMSGLDFLSPDFDMSITHVFSSGPCLSTDHAHIVCRSDWHRMISSRGGT